MAAKITCVVNDAVLSNSGLRGEHGLSFWIETEHGIALLDTGSTSEVLSHNLQVLGLKPEQINALALSHAHYDHTGGMKAILAKNSGLTIYAHADIFRPRYSLRKGEYHSIGFTRDLEELTSRFKLNLSEASAQIFPDLWTTGEISERPEPEGRSANHFIHTEVGWQPDPYKDDLSLVLTTKKGLVVICGCCHAGLLNTLWQVKRSSKQPIISVVGGTHLITADGPSLVHVIDVLADHFPNLYFYLNHCTGKAAINELAKAFSGRVKACPAGTIIKFDD